MPNSVPAPLLHAAPSTDARGVAQQYVDRVLGQVSQQYRSFDEFPYRSWVMTCIVAAISMWSLAVVDSFFPPIGHTRWRLLLPIGLGGWFAGMAWRHRRFDRAFRREAEFSFACTILIFVITVQVNGIRPVMILFASIVSMYIAQRRVVARTGAATCILATAVASTRFPSDVGLFWRALCALVACVLLMEWLTRLGYRAMFTLRDASQSLDAASHELVADRALLVEATARAELEAQRKTDLMAVVSHEIRTPMNAILGLSSLMLQTPVDAQQREWLQRMRENGQHLVGLMSDLLDYTRIESGKAALEQAPFHLDDVLAHVQDVLQRDAAAKGLAVSLSVDDAVPRHLLGDRRRLTQLFLNYVTNAVKFTMHGRVDVRVYATTQAHDANTVRPPHVSLRVEVQDTGVGLTEAQQARCFLPFEQCAPQAMEAGGAGLGLAICRWIASQMDGAVGVHSVPQQGSTFWFVVQLTQAEPVSREFLVPSVMPGTPLPSLAGLRVLVVDDSRINRVVVSEVLRRAGVEVTETESGACALTWLAANATDVVVMDLQMPGMDGLETTRRARERLGAACPPIIAMTASTQPDDEQRCLEAGMVAFLAKPFEPERLQWEVARWARRTTVESALLPAPVTASTAAHPAPELLNVRGLDVAGGLRRMAGDADAYRSLLADLVRDHVGSMHVIRTMLDGGHRDKAITLVHALSGTCAVLGVNEVRAALRELEANLVEGAPISACQEALEDAAAPFEVVLEDLRRVLEHAGAA